MRVISRLLSFSLNILETPKSVHQACRALSGYDMPQMPGKCSIKEHSYSQRLFFEFRVSESPSEGKVPGQAIIAFLFVRFNHQLTCTVCSLVSSEEALPPEYAAPLGRRRDILEMLPEAGFARVKLRSTFRIPDQGEGCAVLWERKAI